MRRDEHYASALRYAFSLRELNLYLDTHPDDTQAISEFRVCRDEFLKHRDEYVAAGGVWDITDGVKGNTFTWIDGPWPWEYDFNKEVDI